MKKVLFVSIVLFCQALIYAQPGAGMWTWMNGDPGLTAVYGTQGVPDPGNRPSWTHDPGFWKGKDGKFWLFGAGNLTDTWSYDPVTNQFAWETGTHTNMSSFGTMGVSSPANIPPMSYAPTCWTDTTGNLWMFGGKESSAGPRNMLWKFDVSTKQWTWIRGTGAPYSVGSYGVKGVASPTNDPGARFAGGGWVDEATNTLWLCLGEFNSGTTGFYNDVWKYNIATNEWTWMAGEEFSSTVTPVNDIYNALGAFDPLNTPAGKPCYNGLGDSAGNGYILLYNDFWKYDITLNQWACIRDDSMRYNPPNHFFCVPSYDYFPHSGYNNTLAARDECGNFWYREEARLWHYNVTLDKFTQVNCISGSAPVYGVKGVPDPANSPCVSRGAAAWIDGDGNFWQFGGTEYSPFTYFSVMWKYTVDSNCVNCSVNNNVFADLLPVYGDQCTPAAMSFTNLSVNAVSYLWDFGDGSPTSTLANPIHNYATAGTYDVTLIAFNGTHSDTAVYYGIEIFDAPVASFTTDVTSGAAVLTVTTNNMSTTGSSMDYIWDFGDGSGEIYATNLFHNYTTDGTYTMYLYVTDNSTGCSDTASLVITVFPVGTSVNDIGNVESLTIAPNPFSEQTTISYSTSQTSVVTIEIYNTIGQRTETIVNEEQAAGKYSYNLNTTQKQLNGGIYFVKFTIDGEVSMRKAIEVK